jgi:hypothetical protein
MRAAIALVASVVILILGGGLAHADVDRYAVLVGANDGAADEERLHFGERDAQRVGEALGDVGGVPAENQILLVGKSAEQVRRALIAMNERIRISGRTAVLFVYYSGHGDADALHLGDTQLPLRELEALVRGSAADVRILVIDSCRSGAVTRVKGGTPAPPITLSDPGGVDEGVIVLTASAAGEDAQESDALGGSFFTHYLISALRGAADTDGDHRVTVAEAFQYTRDQTVLASARTLGGVQHPTFYYDLRGRTELVLASLGTAHGLGRLTLPAGATWLVARKGDDGVVGEIGADAAVRTLSVRAGTYAVHGRARDALLDGTVEVAGDRETTLDPDELSHTTYARLVRKGRGEILPSAIGVFGGPAVRSTIVRGATPCAGAMIGATWARADLTWSPRLAACTGQFRNDTLSARTDAATLDLRVARAWDLPHVTLDVGVTAGAELLHERFTTRGLAPPRTSAAAHVDAGVSALVPLHGRYFLLAEVAVATHVFELADAAGDPALTPRVAVGGVIAIGAWR